MKRYEKLSRRTLIKCTLWKRIGYRLKWVVHPVLPSTLAHYRPALVFTIKMPHPSCLCHSFASLLDGEHQEGSIREHYQALILHFCIATVTKMHWWVHGWVAKTWRQGRIDMHCKNRIHCWFIIKRLSQRISVTEEIFTVLFMYKCLLSHWFCLAEFVSKWKL